MAAHRQGSRYKEFTAPVSRGQRLGTLTVKSGDLVLKEVPLVAAQEVERLSYGEIYRMVRMRRPSQKF